MLIPSLPHMHFFHINDTCYLSCDGSTKFLESIVALDLVFGGPVLENFGSKMLY
jgi:hypothetical protein